MPRKTSKCSQSSRHARRAAPPRDHLLRRHPFGRIDRAAHARPVGRAEGGESEDAPLDAGRVVESGTYDELVKKGGVFTELVMSAEGDSPPKVWSNWPR